jgi:hypothetical protein
MCDLHRATFNSLYVLDDRGFESRQWLRIFLFTTASRLALGPTQPPRQWIQRDLSLPVKRPVHETDHSSPSNAEVKNAWSYTSAPTIRLDSWCSVKAQGRLYFTFACVSPLLHVFYVVIIRQFCISVYERPCIPGSIPAVASNKSKVLSCPSA